MNQDWLDRYGGKISSEWFFSKTLQILNEAPEIYQAADRLIEAADWVVWQLTGVETETAVRLDTKRFGLSGMDSRRTTRLAIISTYNTCLATHCLLRRSSPMMAA